MKVLGIAGPSDSGKTTLVERVTERLSEDGPVATIKHLKSDPDIDTAGKDTARHRDAGAGTTYGITDDGSWFATGSERTLRDALDELAPTYEYALVEGYSDARIPTIALGGREHAGETLLTATDADAVSVDALVDALESTGQYETLESLVTDVTSSADAEHAGAVSTFTGRVRTRDGPEEPTAHLGSETDEGAVEDHTDDLRDELENREGVYEVRLHHRTGVVEAGEDTVFVVVLAGHREAAFRTVEDGIDRLEEVVPIFEKEVTVEDSVEPHERHE